MDFKGFLERLNTRLKEDLTQPIVPVKNKFRSSATPEQQLRHSRVWRNIRRQRKLNDKALEIGGEHSCNMTRSASYKGCYY